MVLVFDITMIQILALYLGLEGAKNMSFESSFGALEDTGGSHSDIDFNMVTDLRYTNIQIFYLYLDFDRNMINVL